MMNTQKIDSSQQEQYGFQQPWILFGGSESESESEQQQNPGPAAISSTNSIMCGFQTPASAFYATERCLGMGFPQGQQISCNNNNNNNNNNNSQFPSFHVSRDNFSVGSITGDELMRNSTKTSHESQMVKSQICFNQYQKPSQVSYNSSANLQGNYVPSPHQFNRNHFPGGNQDKRAYCNSSSYSSPRAQLSYFQQEKQSVLTGAVLANKTRIRWTQDLHDKFVECIKRLGGAEKATPKAILKLMDTEGLTIFHVKSHLQKYRIAKYMPDSAEGKSEKRTITNDVTQIDVNTGLHLTEALQLQLDVQMRLHEQLEIQRNLQMRIEEQGRQLKMMIDQQQKANESLVTKQDLDITSQPSYSLEDQVETSITESSGNVHFPTKIS